MVRAGPTARCPATRSSATAPGAAEPRLAFLFAAAFALVGALVRFARTTIVEITDTELVVHSPGGSSEHHLRAELRADAERLLSRALDLPCG
ncbi:MAG: hypothetical protein JNL79_26065 [Myxococcales bacterium]|nr:hypothetical protein [Myxococcales bacterium]